MMKKLLLIGGGHVHVEVLRRFALRREPDVAITLLSPHRHTAYSAMLPGLVAGHYRFEEAHIDLEPLARWADGRDIRPDLIVWATTAAAAPWIRESGLDVDGNGFMLIDRHLESTSHRHIFGSGDIAALRSTKLPKSGVFAVRKGPVLAHNLRCATGHCCPLSPGRGRWH